ncbi:Tao3 protein [Saccharomycopsis crataegensis]|uniref:Tao3 protein n=1 Tax=Saccharomycopsis crataegensis TaxID=43959 RepID=A0AAV5QL38_9ASCO|nr:Tao3 protein [Saccharomycopsis crataegensis]
MSNYTFPPPPVSSGNDEGSIESVNSFSFPSSQPNTDGGSYQQDNNNTYQERPMYENFGQQSYRYKIIENPEADDIITNDMKIDLDEIQRRSTSLRVGTNSDNNTSGLGFNQIEIPEFDDASNKALMRSNSIANSIKLPEASYLQNNPSNINTPNSNNMSNFSFPLKSPINDNSDHVPTNNSKAAVSRLGSIRSIRNKGSATSMNQDKPQPLPSFQAHNSIQSKSINNMNTANTQDVRRVLTTELKTPSEYTLHMIFTQFIRLAERKLNATEPLDGELSIKYIESLKRGNDALFDKVVTSLGYIAKKQPQQVVDSVMYWRKAKGNQVDSSVDAYNKNKHLLSLKQKQLKGSSHGSSSSKMSLHSRNGSSQSSSMSFTREKSNSNGSDLNPNDAMSLQFLENQVEQARQIFVQTENRANAAAYLVCRVLIEVVKQIPLNSENMNFYNTLEENIYHQLKSMDPANVLNDKMKLINWNCLTILIGEISAKRFSRISDKFIADLEKSPANISRSTEMYLCLLVRGMRNLKLTNYPLEEFEESCGFLSSVAKFFYKSTSYMMINAYCETLTELLLPLCEVLNAETDLPVWADVVKSMLKKINSVIDKPKYWESAFELMCVCLSVSPSTIFYDNWYDLLIYQLSNKLTKANNIVKDPNDYLSFSMVLKDAKSSNLNTISKITLLKSTARLVWTYIFRCTESLNKTTKKLDAIFKVLFFQNTNSKKQQWLTYDLEVLKPLVILLRSIGYSNINYTMESLLLPLIKQSFNMISLDNISQERLLIVLKSYILILDDLISNSRPKYPTCDFIDSAFDAPSSNFNTINIKEVLNTKNVNQNDILYHEEISNYFCKLFLMLDNEIGTTAWSTVNTGINAFGQLGSIQGGSDAPSISSPSFLSSKSPFSSFLSSDSSQQLNKKQLNIDLFEKLAESIPWFYQLSNVIPYKKLVEILTRNSVHENPKISKVSIATLKKLCNKKNSGSLISTFAKFAFNFAEENNSAIKYRSSFLTSSSETYEKLLKIYLDLLMSWLSFLRSSAKPDNGALNNDGNDFYILNGNFKMNMANTKLNKDGPGDNPSGQGNDPHKDLELNAIVATIEQVEGNGLFFLCSRSTIIRRLAVAILKIIPKFDEVIFETSTRGFGMENGPISDVSAGIYEKSNGKHTRSKSKFAADVDTRLIHILETVPFFDLIGSLKLQLSMPERKKLASLKSRNRKDLLVKLAEADYGVELTLWFKVLPKLLSIIFEKNPVTMALCRSIVCVRMIQIHEYISEFADMKPKGQPAITSGSSNKLFFSGSVNSGTDTQPEVIIEQWKLFLIVACTSLTSTGKQELPPLPGSSAMTHQRKVSNNRAPLYSINSAKSLFNLVIPLLSTEQPLITDAIHSGLSCININIFKALVEVIQPIRSNWETEIRAGSVNEANMRIRIEVTRILHATSKYLSEEQIYSDKRLLKEMIAYVKTVRSFLGASKVQESFEYQKLRRYFCGLLENVFTGVQKTPHPDKWFPFEARSGCFTFLEEWCGYGDSAGIAKKRYQVMRMDKKYSSNPTFSAAIELETTALEYSAVSSMATLCSGAMNQIVKDNKSFVVMAIDYKSLISWIKAIFETDDDILHRLGKKGLKNLLAFNKEKVIFDQAIKEFYNASHKNNKTAESYFVTICETLLENNSYSCEAFEIIVLALYAVGLPSLETRKLAGKLLVYIEKRFYEDNSVEKLVDCICSTSKAVYKKAADNLSRYFSVKYSKEKYNVISLLSLYFHKVAQSSQRDILTIMIPWVEAVNMKKLEFDAAYYLLPSSRDICTEMVLNNLIEITTHAGGIYTPEVESLWVGLVQGNEESNASVIIDYMFAICLHKRITPLIESAKQVVNYVYFSCPTIIEELMKNINPKAMIPPESRPVDPLKNTKLPYVYVLPGAASRDLFSLGQISTIFLVDLLKMKPQSDLIIKNLPMLLNISVILLDHYLAIVRVHAVELLCTVLHELAYNDEKAMATIENLRKHDIKSVWTYEDLHNDRNGARTPKNMDQLIRTSLEALVPEFSNLQVDWSRITLSWATTCSVRHIACRSFQAFRSLLSFLDKTMLADMLHRLSSTISDPNDDIQGFAMQILMSLNAITAELSAEKLISFPELFWAAVACLSTVHEKEFLEVISIISKFISKIDLNSEDTISCLISTFPTKWEGKFEGLQNIVMIGLRSSNAWEPSMKLLDRLNKLTSSEVIAGPSRLLMALMANMPRFLHAFEEQEFTEDIQQAAEILSNMALAENQQGVSRIVLSLANNKFRKKEDFISQALYLIKESYFPEYQSQCLVFLLGLLMNKIKWVKLETMELLKYLLPMNDLTREEFQGVGADLLSPLLRLLLTEYSEKALEVLDETDHISGSQLDKDFIRLSLGNRTLRKEYEKIATLFGVPDDSGWSIPMSAVTAAITKQNVHAVYLTCRNQLKENGDQQESTNQQVEGAFEFHDDREEPVHFYDENPEKRSISNMYATLNYFESFFEADADIVSNTDSENTQYHDRSLSTETSKLSSLVNDGLDRTDSNSSYRLDPYNSNNYNNYINYGNY